METYDRCITEKPLQQLQLLVCMKTLSKTLVLQLTNVKDVIQRQLILWHQFFPLSYYSYLLPYILSAPGCFLVVMALLFENSKNMWSKPKQECIPVGCVPTATVATTRCQYWGMCVWCHFVSGPMLFPGGPMFFHVCVFGGLYPGGLCLGVPVHGVSVQRGSLSRGSLFPEGVSVQRRGLCPEGSACLPSDRMTDAFENITLPCGRQEWIKAIQNSKQLKRHQRTTICEEKKFQIKEYATKLLFFSMSLHREPCDYK